MTTDAELESTDVEILAMALNKAAADEAQRVPPEYKPSGCTEWDDLRPTQQRMFLAQARYVLENFTPKAK